MAGLQETLRAVYGAAEHERMIIVVPSPRVPAHEFLEHLRRNGIDCRALAAGTCKVVDREGRRYRVSGVIIGSLHSAVAERAKKIALLCGLTAIIYD